MGIANLWSKVLNGYWIAHRQPIIMHEEYISQAGHKKRQRLNSEPLPFLFANILLGFLCDVAASNHPDG
jgi:hypothetical protein